MTETSALVGTTTVCPPSSLALLYIEGEVQHDVPCETYIIADRDLNVLTIISYAKPDERFASKAFNTATTYFRGHANSTSHIARAPEAGYKS